MISLVRQAVNNRTVAAFLATVSRSASKSLASAFTSSVARLCVAGGSFAARGKRSATIADTMPRVSAYRNTSRNRIASLFPVAGAGWPVLLLRTLSTTSTSSAAVILVTGRRKMAAGTCLNADLTLRRYPADQLEQCLSIHAVIASCSVSVGAGCALMSIPFAMSANRLFLICRASASEITWYIYRSLSRPTCPHASYISVATFYDRIRQRKDTGRHRRIA